MVRSCLAIFLCAAATFGTTWHVPGNSPTIQAAFDSLSDGDTVLVAVGIYHESLHAPNHPFVWLGEVDSAGTPDRPVVDPSPLEGSTHLACLTLPSQSRAVIENMIFRNGPEMFPREDAGAGGIQDSALDLVVRRCTFDSTYKGLYLDVGTVGTLTVSDCDFVDNVECCLCDRNASPASIFHSSFSGTGMLGWFLDSTLIDNCIFLPPVQGAEALWVMGARNSVKRCTFGPTIVPGWDIIWTGSSRGCSFEDNLFHDIEARGAVIIFNGDEGDTSYFHRNAFRNCRGVESLYAGGGLNLDGPMHVVVSECTFDSCTTWSPYGFGAIDISRSDGLIINNRFIGHNTPATAIRAYNSSGTVIHDCFFEGNGVALNSNLWMNAEMNWWGDSTGPYHASANPDGLGDEITGPVDFEPWLTDTALTAPDSRAPLPQSCQLEVFPNPFNATATLQLTVNVPGIYTVELYNLLGERVSELWSGWASSEIEFQFDAAKLTSGLYFARVSMRDEPITVAMAKIVLLK